MNFLDRLFRKKSIGRTILVANQVGRPAMSEKNFETFAREGYGTNVIAYRCVSLIARSAMRVPMQLVRQTKSGVEVVEKHPVVDLLYRPNPITGYASLIEQLISFYCISGNAYIEAVSADSDTPLLTNKPPLELWVLPSGNVAPVKGVRGLPMAYELFAFGKTVRFPVDQVSGSSRIFHIKTFNPIDPWIGMSPMQAASYTIDVHNEASRWNFSLLRNSASPSGVLQ